MTAGKRLAPFLRLERILLPFQAALFTRSGCISATIRVATGALFHPPRAVTAETLIWIVALLPAAFFDTDCPHIEDSNEDFACPR